MLNLAVVAVATAGVIDWFWVALPVALLVAWLVACRLMVKRERAGLPALVSQVAEALTEEPADPVDVLDADTDSMLAVDALPTDPALWDPVPSPCRPTSSKSAAHRTVRTIDLDATGVWTSGRSEADSRLARDAEEAERTERDAQAARDKRDRAVGS